MLRPHVWSGSCWDAAGLHSQTGLQLQEEEKRTVSNLSRSSQEDKCCLCLFSCATLNLNIFGVCSVNSYQQYEPGGCADCAAGLESSPSPSCPENKYLVNRSLLIAHFLIWAVYPLQCIWEGDQNSKYHRYSWNVSSNKHLKKISLIQIWSHAAKIKSVGSPNLG